MSYRIDPDRPIRKNARRKLDGALAALDEPGDLGLEGTVHDVRKRCKKVRGLIRLVRPGLGTEYSRANAEVRDAARELSPLRDAHAMLGTFDDVIAATHGDRLPGDGLIRVREGLVRRAGEADRADADGPLERARGRLARARARVSTDGRPTTTSRSSWRASRTTTAAAARPFGAPSTIRPTTPCTCGASA